MIVFYGGVRSAALNCREVVGLLHDIIGEDASAVSKHVSIIIAKKNLVEYEGRLVTEKEGRDMVNHAMRFMEWIIGILPNK